MSLANFVALNDFGGLQTLYLSFAAHRARECRPLLTINRSEEPPLPFFSSVFSEMGGEPLTPSQRVAYRVAKSVIPWDIARKIAQRFYLERDLGKIFRQQNVDRTISWNAVPSRSFVPPNGSCVLYDHGFSSIHKPTREKRERLNIVQSIVAISKANARLLQERWDWHGHIDTIANPLRHAIAHQTLVERRDTLRHGAVTIGCASRLVSFKGIASVVHAVAILRQRGLNVSLRIAGDGPEAELLKKAVQDLNIGDFVQFDGIVADMSSFFSMIDIFVAPSLREPFGLSPMEALASGVPTILSNVDGHTESLPFEDAAVVIEPDLPLSRYVKLGASLNKMPAFVYSPSRDRLAIPMALCPAAISDAVERMSGEYNLHAAKAFDAGTKIRDRNSMNSYAARFAQIFENSDVRQEPALAA